MYIIRKIKKYLVDIRDRLIHIEGKIDALLRDDDTQSYNQSSENGKTVDVKVQNISLKNFTLRVALAEGGGVGDAIMDTQFLKAIAEMSNKSICIDFYCRSYKLFSKYPFINHSYPYTTNIDKSNYDVIFIGHRFMIINHLDDDRVATYSKDLYEYCKDCRKLIEIDMANNLNDNLITQYALLKGKKRIEQCNINDILPFDRYTKKYMPLMEAEFAILDQYNLRDCQYIVVNRAVDEKYDNNHPKLWPLDNYNKLVRELKLRYPSLKIVMVGDSDKFDPISLVDVNLVKKTNLEQCKVILKHSILLIAGEGGLVHMKNFLYGQSVVVFGPTLPEIFGYEENVNLRGNGCPRTCEWVTDKWADGCVLEYREPKCIYSTSVEDVYNAACEMIEDKLREFRYQIQQYNGELCEVVRQLIDSHEKTGYSVCTIEQCDSDFSILLKKKVDCLDIYMEKNQPKDRCHFIHEYYGSPCIIA